jgi:hypothetical protein
LGECRFGSEADKCSAKPYVRTKGATAMVKAAAPAIASKHWGALEPTAK